MQIGNIQGILWESLQGIWRNNEGKLSVNFIYPLTLEILLDNVKDQCRYLLRAKRKHVNTVTFITINLGRSHWTLLVIDNQREKNILYFDSLGNLIPSSLRDAMASLFPDFKGLDLKVWPQIQFENYHCGVWARWASSIFLEQLRIGAPLITTPFHKYVRLNGKTNEDSQLFNTSFITEVRGDYTTP